MPVLVPPMRRIAVRNSSDEMPAAAIPASRMNGHGEGDRNGTSSASPWPVSTASTADPTTADAMITNVAASAGTAR